MNELMISGTLRMTTVEIAALCEKRHDHVLRDARAMLDKLELDHPKFGAVFLDAYSRSQPCLSFPKELILTLVAGYKVVVRKRIIDRWLELEAAATATVVPLSNAAMFMQSAQLMVSIENQLTEQKKVNLALSSRIEELAITRALSQCPSNAESISHIRKRMSQAYGLPIHVIDAVMRQLPYSIKPAAMVVNSHEGAEGQRYAAFWKKDVSTVFKRFVSECRRETSAFVSHPFIDFRFKLDAGKVA